LIECIKMIIQNPTRMMALLVYLLVSYFKMKVIDYQGVRSHNLYSKYFPFISPFSVFCWRWYNWNRAITARHFSSIWEEYQLVLHNFHVVDNEVCPVLDYFCWLYKMMFAQQSTSSLYTPPVIFPSNTTSNLIRVFIYIFSFSFCGTSVWTTNGSGKGQMW
jgi:hypothetical protein